MSVDPGGRPAAAAPGVVAVAFCPSPPLLVPDVEGRAAEETATLRAACDDAVGALLSAGPGTVLVMGAGAGPGARFCSGDTGTLRGFGVDLDVPFAGEPRAGGRRLPLAHTVGAWLLDPAGSAVPRVGVGPAGLGAALAELSGPVGLLAMGDGSARRTVKAPGYLDPAAEPFDAAVAAALATGNAAALRALDPADGQRLLAAGVDTWRAVGAALAGRPITARLRYDGAPFGVGYLVADWAVG